MTVYDDPTIPVRKRIEQSDTELRYAAARLSAQTSAAKQRIMTLNEQAAAAEKQKLEVLRNELQQIRTEAFKKLALQ